MNEAIVECLYAAIDETNKGRSGAAPLAKSPDAPLYGSSSELDSLGLVNFVVAAEHNVERAFGKSIVLADDRALSREPSPFGSVRALAEYIEVLLEEME
jgi:acyl carrier protein